MIETKRAARIAEQWINSDFARLHEGELTPDEALLVAAVAQAIAAEIRRTGGRALRGRERVVTCRAGSKRVALRLLPVACRRDGSMQERLSWMRPCRRPNGLSSA